MEEHITALLDDMEAGAAEITGVRGPGRPDGTGTLLKEVARIRGRPLFYPYIGSGRGRGALVELADGSVKWDFITGIGTNFFGHGDRRMREVALRAALSDVPIQGHLQPNREYAEFLTALSGVAPGRCVHAWPSLSGSMANENALKIIRQKKHPAWRILRFSDAFAGRSAALSEITDNDLNKKGQPDLGQAVHIPFYDPEETWSTARTLDEIQAALRRHPGECAALHVELIQGEGGFREAPREFFSAVFELCLREGLAVWVDEIQTFGRTGEFFALERMGLAELADVVTVGKMLCGSAVLFSPEYNPEPGLISGTFAGYTVGLALGADVIQRLSDEGHVGAAGKIRILEKALTEILGQMRDGGRIRDFTAVGCMAALTPNRSNLDAVKDLIRRLFDAGLCVYYAGHREPYRLRMLLPGGCLGPEDLSEPFDILNRELAV
ncbi:aminotransferase class III-fold pyridoxal phosphate-dependent enzyme [bacterium]|nr:aminotransferase class III-fold pyridoxal phosphate-dependent enzyme [bacterium]